MKLTDKELKALPNNCIPFNSGGAAVIINKKILKELTAELIELRSKMKAEKN